MTSGERTDQTIRFDPSFIDRPQPMTVVFRGIEYTGEVILKDESSAQDLTAPLIGESSFRIILGARRLRPRAEVSDRRICLAALRQGFNLFETLAGIGDLPSPAPGQIRDAQVEYLVSTTMDGAAARVWSNVINAYGEGEIYGHPNVELKSGDVFRGSSISKCLASLADVLLEEAYPEPVFDSARFPGPLTLRVLDRLYSGLFKGDRSARDVLSSYGVGLGLARHGNHELEVSASRVFDFIRELLVKTNGDIRIEYCEESLVHILGLNRLLARFYLVSFVGWEDAEIRLPSNHGLLDRRGGPFAADRITNDLLSELDFSGIANTRLDRLTYRSEPTFKTLLPYVRSIIEVDESEVDEARVVSTASRLRRQASEVIDTLSTLWPTPKGRSRLRGLTTLSNLDGHTGLYENLREQFGSPSGLSEAVGELERAMALVDSLESVNRHRQILESMDIAGGHKGIRVDRDLLIARIEMENLVRNPSLWPSIEVEVGRLAQRYQDSFASFHEEYHSETTRLDNELESRNFRVRALGMLGTVPELGEPVGRELPARYREIANALKRCNVSSSDLIESDTLGCDVCGIALGTAAPTKDVEEVSGLIDRAMREYNRILGSRAVRQVLSRRTDQGMDTFRNLVQVADPRSLENVLDEQLIQFLREFLTQESQ